MRRWVGMRVRGSGAPGGRAGPNRAVLLRGLRVLVARVRGCGVGEVAEVRHVVSVDAVTEGHLLALEEAGDRLLLDVDDVVAQPAPVREAGVVAAQHAHAADLRRGGDRD